MAVVHLVGREGLLLEHLAAVAVPRNRNTRLRSSHIRRTQHKDLPHNLSLGCQHLVHPEFLEALVWLGSVRRKNLVSASHNRLRSPPHTIHTLDDLLAHTRLLHILVAAVDYP